MSQREGVVNMREVILPAKQSFPRHAHMAEEEIFVVVRGRGTLLDTLLTQ
jgi:uncharacterized cupin superfamily protein